MDRSVFTAGSLGTDLAGLAMLTVLVWIVSWLTSSVLSRLVRRLLKVAGKDDWARLVKKRFVPQCGLCRALAGGQLQSDLAAPG